MIGESNHRRLDRLISRAEPLRLHDGHLSDVINVSKLFDGTIRIRHDVEGGFVAAARKRLGSNDIMIVTDRRQRIANEDLVRVLKRNL